MRNGRCVKVRRMEVRRRWKSTGDGSTEEVAKYGGWKYGGVAKEGGWTYGGRNSSEDGSTECVAKYGG